MRSERAPEGYAPRTILRICAAVRVLFADALAEEIVTATPCSLRSRRGELPAKRDADPRWRAHAVYERGEVESLISDPRVPLDRRVLYALILLAGMRPSEATGRRWRDYDPKAQPLGRLLVATQAAPTKTGDVKEVPVIPALAELLEGWHREGFAKTYARHPSPDDLITPSTLDGRTARTEWTTTTLKTDLDALGLRTKRRSRHAMRVLRRRVRRPACDPHVRAVHLEQRQERGAS